jgi:very-short-patch-repair endonuclease
MIKASKTSQLEEAVAFQFKAAQVLPPTREYRFDAQRRWRFDFAWPDQRLALEVEGGTWTAGRHSRGKGIEGDCEKYNSALLAGWRVLRVTGDQVANGQALAWVEAALALMPPRDKVRAT